jgi:protein ImuB
MPEERTGEISPLIAILHKWGVHTLGQLVALPRDELAARLGPAALRFWEQATGKSTRLLRLVRPAEIFSEYLEFEYEIETAEPLLFILRRFLDQLTRRLGALYLVVQELTFRLVFADKTEYRHRFQIPEPTNSAELLFRLLQTHLENFRSEHPIVAVGLEAQPARSGQQQFQFFETPLRDPARLHETLNRLTGLLGKERVGTPVPEDSHRPDAFYLQPFVWNPAPLPNDSARESHIGPALRRFRLGSLSSPKATIRARQGPYLSSGQWWDEQMWNRRDWDCELTNGSVCRCQERTGEWILEGVYD